jgi:hypothetical protein
MTDAPFWDVPVPVLDKDGKIPAKFFPAGIGGGGGGGITITTDAAGDTVLTIIAGSTAARLTTNANGDTVLTLTGA